MRYLSARDIAGLASPATLIAAMEQALRDYAQDKVIVPPRAHTEFKGNTLLTMPVVGEGAFGAKIVSVIPSNARRGIPVTNGLMTLSDANTGVPLAVLNAAALTAQRTGAVGAVGLKYTTPPDIDRLGVVGIGVQGAWQAIYACAVRQIRTICFIGRSAQSTHRFVETVSQKAPSVRLHRFDDVRDLLANVEVIVTATPSNDPVLPDQPALLKNKHFVSIGSFRPSMQELPNCVYELAGEVTVDSAAAGSEVGDLINPLASGLLRKDSINHIADLVVGKRTVDTTRTTVFKSVGMGLYDLYAAHACVAEAQRLDRGVRLEP